ncbi:MAG: DUF2848 family protein [Desulfobacteraceae bacterium]|jgi:hypothetical protein
MGSPEGMVFRFIIEGQKEKREFPCQMRGAVLCGYTGRDQSAVRKHIEELKKEGVEPPPSVPMFYPKPYQGISLGEAFHVQGRETSGEVEYVLLMDGDRIYVGAGSDHTDRELERMDILKSKQVCPAILSKNLWDFEEIKDHWDSIQIRSWAVQGGERTLYQDSTLSTILPPEELVRLVQQRVEVSLEGIAIFSGTPPMVTEQILFSERFEGELLDPILNRKISFGYSIHTLDWFKAT